MAGVITMPTALYYGSEGGGRFSGRVDYQLRNGGFGGEFGSIDVSLRYNDPDVLALFPYAEDALDVHFLLSFGG